MLKSRSVTLFDLRQLFILDFCCNFLYQLHNWLNLCCSLFKLLLFVLLEFWQGWATYYAILQPCFQLVNICFALNLSFFKCFLNLKLSFFKQFSSHKCANYCFHDILLKNFLLVNVLQPIKVLLDIKPNIVIGANYSFTIRIWISNR